MTAGQKRQRSETPSEPQTPSKRMASIQAGLKQRSEGLATSSLSPAAREKRKRLIQEGLDSVPTTPSRHAPGATRGNLPTHSHPVGIERRNLFASAPLKTLTKPPPSKPLDEEDAFWTSSSPPSLLVPIKSEPQPKSGPSSAGYHPGGTQSPAPRAGPSREMSNGILTPPRSSPFAEDFRAASPSSTTQVSDILRRSPEPDTVNNRLTAFGGPTSVPATPRGVSTIRGTSATPGPSTPSKSIDTDDLRDILGRLADLQGLPDEVDKLQRKLRATEQGAQRKQERIRELEDQLQRLQREYNLLEDTISSWGQRR